MHASAAGAVPTPLAMAETGIGSEVTMSDVSAWYGTAPALLNVSMVARARSITALIGPSGCGKTTLLRSINRLNDLIRGFRLVGNIAIDGSEVYGSKVPVERVRRRIGMIFQRPAPLPMSIQEDVAYGIKLHGLARSRSDLHSLVEESLRRAALWEEVKDRLHQPGRSLSGGQQQRLCLARALAVKPDVVLMDEPCAALDPIATAKIESLIVELAKEITVIIVTHNMGQARRVAHTTVVMLPAEQGGGELVEMGPTESIFTSPRDPRTAGYVEGRFG